MQTFAAHEMKLIKSLIDKFRQSRERGLFPEKKYIVEFDEKIIRCKKPDGSTEQVTWDEFHKLEIHTNSLGPFVDDVYFVLHGANNGCYIPQGGTNVSELLEKLYKLPNFNSENFGKAMSFTDDNIFIIWEKFSGTWDGVGSSQHINMKRKRTQNKPEILLRRPILASKVSI
jgi:hypothetical protein